MVPSSDELEDFYRRLMDLRAQVEAEGAAVLAVNAAVVQAVGTLAKDWLRLSQRLRAAGVVDVSILTKCDGHMGELLTGRSDPRRADTHYRRSLNAVEGVFTSDVIIPVVKNEGDPRQIAVRDLRTALDPHLTVAEKAYSEEALKCVTEACNRAGIVMLWAAAVTRLHGSVERLGFPAFSQALANTGTKKSHPFTAVRDRSAVTSRPELQRVPDFSVLVAGMELWGYDLQAFNELARLLETRNNAAHPGMASPRLLDVQHFTDKLIERVFAFIPA